MKNIILLAVAVLAMSSFAVAGGGKYIPSSVKLIEERKMEIKTNFISKNGDTIVVIQSKSPYKEIRFILRKGQLLYGHHFKTSQRGVSDKDFLICEGGSRKKSHCFQARLFEVK